MVNNLEHLTQSAFIQWCRLSEKKHPELATIFAIPNGEYRPISVAKRLKAEGVRAGVPDLLLPVDRCLIKDDSNECGWGMYNALYIEFKAPGGHLSKAQRIVGHNLAVSGNLVVVVWSSEAAIEVVESYLGGEMPKFKKKYIERIT